MIKKVAIVFCISAACISCSKGLIDNAFSPISFALFNKETLYVADINPADGAIDVPTATVIDATFTRALSPSSVTSYTFVVADESYIPVPGTLAYNALHKKVTFTPLEGLLNLTEYNILVTTDITDREGNSLAEERIWYFTTISGGSVPAPTFGPPAGTYDGAQNIIMECEEPAATIRYTLDGTTPSRTNGSIYTGPVAVSISTIMPVQALAYRDGFGDSPVAAASYIIKVLPPVLEPMPGQFSSDTTITMTSATPGAAILYTLDGTDPATSGTAVTYSPLTPPTVTPGTTPINAIAIDPSSAMANSTLISCVYVVDYTQVAPPVFTPPIGVYSTSFTVTMTSATPGATIKYTTDGSSPSSTNGTTGTSVAITGTTVLKAYAYAAGLTDSDITNSSGIPYIIAPVITAIVPNKGANLAPVTVTIKGKNFKSGAGARLALSGYADIIGTSVTVESGTQLTCTFDITGAFQTKWDLVVTNPDGGSSTNIKYFRIY